jgi:hypothetical protein
VAANLEISVVTINTVTVEYSGNKLPVKMLFNGYSQFVLLPD